MKKSTQIHDQAEGALKAFRSTLGRAIGVKEDKVKNEVQKIPRERQSVFALVFAGLLAFLKH